jgi:hypothetical protein
MVEASPYVPTPGCATPVPGWKKNAAFKDYLPRPPALKKPDPQG